MQGNFSYYNPTKLYFGKNAIENLKVDVNIIQNGDSDGPFWNGALACASLKEVLKVAERSSTLVNELEVCSEKIINK